MNSYGPIALVGTKEVSDEELLSTYRRTRSRQAFAELVHRYERELYSYLRRYLGNEMMAEDAFQATFLQVHLKCNQFEEGRKFRPWVYTIATHQAIDAQRRNKRHLAVSLDRQGHVDDEENMVALLDVLRSDEAEPESQFDADEMRTWVRGAVDALPPTLREAVTLIYFQGMKYREAAQVLNVPVGTVKSRLHAAILKLNRTWRSERTSEET